MFVNPKERLARKISISAGVEASVVSKVLTELANQAYASVASGFVLPGFGKFHVVPGAERTGTNPFIGKSVVFRAPPEIEFTFDTAAKKSFIAGRAESGEASASGVTTSALQAIVLVPNPKDIDAAGVESDTTYEFKIGGEPDWIQSAEVPICCGVPMLFYGQLDSLGGNYCIGDMGKIYVFLCRSCSSSRSAVQF